MKCSNLHLMSITLFKCTNLYLNAAICIYMGIRALAKMDYLMIIRDNFC